MRASSGGAVALEEAKAKVNRLESEIAGVRVSLEQGLRALNVSSSAADAPDRSSAMKTIEGQLEALMSECGNSMAALDKAFADLRLSQRANESLQQRLKGLVSDFEEARQLQTTLTTNVTELEVQLAAAVEEKEGLQRQAAAVPVCARAD